MGVVPSISNTDDGLGAIGRYHGIECLHHQDASCEKTENFFHRFHSITYAEGYSSQQNVSCIFFV